MAKTKAELCGEITELSTKLALVVPEGLEKLTNLQLDAILEELENKATAPATAASTGTTAAGDTPPVSATAAPLDGDGALPDTAGAKLLPVSPDAAGNVLEAPPRERRPLPLGHKRPTVEEFVASGYKAENYEAAMTEWEAELQGIPYEPSSPLTAPPTAKVDGADSGTLGGPPKRGETLRSGYPFSVAEGHSVVCRKGTIGSFQRIRAIDLARGEAQLAELVASGVVVDNTKA